MRSLLQVPTVLPCLSRLTATLAILCLARSCSAKEPETRIDPRVDATPDWAVLWSEFRIRVGTNAAGRGEVELSAPATAFPPAEWQRRTEAFFQTVARQLALGER